LDFHQRLRAGYLEIARREPERCVVIDADAELDAVTGAIWAVVAQRLDL
jgi:dTMP kinase